MIELRQIRKEDIHAYHQAINSSSPECNKYTGGPSKLSLEVIDNYLNRIIKDDSRFDYLMIQDEKIIGEVVLNEISDDDSANIRIAIFDENYFGKGYGSYAMNYMLKVGFEDAGLNRIELEVYDFNERAYGMYKKLGFVEEGRLRQAYKSDDYHDIIVMSMLKKEYKARKS